MVVRTRIGVIGAGIIGLSSAIRIQEEFPDEEITIIAEKFSPETTSDKAAGIWGPYLLGNTPANDVYKWSNETFHYLHELWRTEDGGKLGVSMIPCVRVSSNEDYSHAFWKDIVYGFRSLSDKELRSFGKPSLRYGCGFVTFTVESPKLLPYFMDMFKNRGGKVVKEKVESLEQLCKRFDIIVNCTGVQAHYLAKDKEVHPIRGQIIRVKAPGIKWAIMDDDDDGNYVIPNQETVVLGGTHQKGDWNCVPYSQDTEFIRNGCARIIPSLKDAPVVREVVGLRPGRTCVRLDMEMMEYPGEKPWFISNYGHGGSGLTIFWGCAKDTVEHVRTAITRLQMMGISKL